MLFHLERDNQHQAIITLRRADTGRPSCAQHDAALNCLEAQRRVVHLI